MYDLSSNRILPTDYTVDEEVNIKIIANGCDNSNRKDSGGDYDGVDNVDADDGEYDDAADEGDHGAECAQNGGDHGDDDGDSHGG